MVLMFFMGLRNALLVGISVPLSSLMAFMVLQSLGITINMVVLFSLVLALGMLVDNAIVVIENIYRLRESGLSINRSSIEGPGEVAIAIISSTLTTLAAFFAFDFFGRPYGRIYEVSTYNSYRNSFSSSLFVGLIINPVFSSLFIRVRKAKISPNQKLYQIIGLSSIVLSIPFFIISSTYLVPNILLTLAFIFLGNAYFFPRLSIWFQHKFLAAIEIAYKRLLKWILKSTYQAIKVFLVTCSMLVLSLGIFYINLPSVIFFSRK